MFKTFLVYCQLARLDKPIGALLLLWPTLWALWLAGYPTLYFITIFVLGVFIMRAAGCIINDFADRKFDQHVERTKNRPLANGKLNEKNALCAFVFLIFMAFLLLLALPPLTWFFACFALLTTILYPFMKRFTYFPQIVLGIAFSWSIPMAYAATLGSLPYTCWLLFMANICWIIAYDTEYAMVDRNDDLKIGIKSTAIFFGQYDKLAIGILQLTMIVILMTIGILHHFSLIYYIGLLVATCLFIYQQILIIDRDRKNCFKAFQNNNYVGLIIFVGILLDCI